MSNGPYTDPFTGEQHDWSEAALFSWHCSIHNRVCDPFPRRTKQQVADYFLRKAVDADLDDDAFVMVSRAIRGEDPLGGDEPEVPA